MPPFLNWSISGCGPTTGASAGAFGARTRPVRSSKLEVDTSEESESLESPEDEEDDEEDDEEEDDEEEDEEDPLRRRFLPFFVLDFFFFFVAFFVVFRFFFFLSESLEEELLSDVSSFFTGFASSGFTPSAAAVGGTNGLPDSVGFVAALAFSSFLSSFLPFLDGFGGFRFN